MPFSTSLWRHEIIDVWDLKGDEIRLDLPRRKKREALLFIKPPSTPSIEYLPQPTRQKNHSEICRTDISAEARGRESKINVTRSSPLHISPNAYSIALSPSFHLYLTRRPKALSAIMPPHLHPRSTATSTLFASTLAASFIVITIPHVFPCPRPNIGQLDSAPPAPRESLSCTTRSEAGQQAAEEASVFHQLELEAIQHELDQKKRECPVPKPKTVIGRLLGYEEWKPNEERRAALREQVEMRVRREQEAEK